MFFRLALKDLRMRWGKAIFVYLSIFLLVVIFSYLTFFTERVYDIVYLIDRPVAGDHLSFRVYPKKRRSFNYAAFQTFYENYVEEEKCYASAIESHYGAGTDYVVGFGSFGELFLPELDFSKFTGEEIPVAVGKNVRDYSETFEHPLYGKCRVVAVLEKHRNFVHYQSMESFDDVITLLPQKGQIFRTEQTFYEYPFTGQMMDQFFQSLCFSEGRDFDDVFGLLSDVGLYELVPSEKEENVKYINYGHLRSLLLYLLTYAVSFLFLLFSFDRLIADRMRECRRDYMIHFLSGATERQIFGRVIAYIVLLTMPPILLLLFLRSVFTEIPLQEVFFDLRAIFSVSVVILGIGFGSATVRLHRWKKTMGKEGVPIGRE